MCSVIVLLFKASCLINKPTTLTLVFANHTSTDKNSKALFFLFKMLRQSPFGLCIHVTVTHTNTSCIHTQSDFYKTQYKAKSRCSSPICTHRNWHCALEMSFLKRLTRTFLYL